jgi:hypothetical protein
MRAVTRRWRLPETSHVGLRFANPTYKDFSWILGAKLPDPPGILVFGLGLETLDHGVAEGGRERRWPLEDKAPGFHLTDRGQRRDGTFDNGGHGD